MNTYLLSPVQFLISTLFSLYILAVMLRFILQWRRADFYNPVSQFLVKVTNPPLRPLRRVIPGLVGLDMASVVLMILLQMLALAAIVALQGANIGVLPLLLWSAVELVELAFNVFIFAILIQALLSWVNPGHTPVTAVLWSITEPVLAPIRRVIGPVSGIDLSPLAGIIGLQVIKMLVVPPLRYVAVGG